MFLSQGFDHVVVGVKDELVVGNGLTHLPVLDLKLFIFILVKLKQSLRLVLLPPERIYNGFDALHLGHVLLLLVPEGGGLLLPSLGLFELFCENVHLICHFEIFISQSLVHNLQFLIDSIQQLQQIRN